MSASRKLAAIAALSFLGFGISVYQSEHFYNLRYGAAGFRTFCNLNETMNCDAVAASPYAEVIGGLPLSSFAAAWFLLVFSIALIGRKPFWFRESSRALLALGSFGTLVAIVMFGIQAAILKNFCLLCLFVEALLLFILILSVMLKPERYSAHPIDNEKWRIFAGIGATAFISVVFLLKILFEPESADLVSSDAIIDATLKSAPLAVSAGPSLPSMGAGPDAPITIVEFSDFQCPYCQNAAFVLSTLLNRYKDRVRLVFRNFPWDNVCNRKVTHPMHPVSCEAARVAVCAHKQGKFKAVYEILFQNQSSLKPGKPVEFAASTGVDLKSLNECLNSSDSLTTIAQDVEDGILLNIDATPTFFINGHKLEGGLSEAGWEKLINRILHPQ